MGYKVKELFYTLQGEGAQAGRAAIFCRFTGCNLWTGREADRAMAVCKFCDTDFLGTDGVGGGRFKSSSMLAAQIEFEWTNNTKPGTGKPFVVFTGGEPALQLDEELIQECQRRGFEVAIETNGTLPIPSSIDWICVSPKAAEPLAITTGHELKLVYPQVEIEPSQFENLDFDHFYIQPMDGPNAKENTVNAVAFCQRNPTWKLSIQMHKLVGIP
ncbi:MAG: 7-carboxy-7-deazaguanine synthase [Myxococcota bacterium]|nr:7-carboxy-7-deazaguanine synthase [Myxococcota bacterium]